MAEDYEIDFFMESSAKTGMNVQNIFIHAAKILYKELLTYKENKKKNKDNNASKLNDKKNGNKKKCC